MNYNLLTYSIYLPIICFITFRVGWLFFKNGEVFLLKIFNENPIALTINKLLLIGYYLVNIGWAVLAISFWDIVSDAREVIETLTWNIGQIILFLALLHFNNIIVLKYISKKTILNK